ncbi:RNA polymerase sigma factor [Flavobacterium piscisymbiosum]|jgi:RNA polymerase sigma factor (sigma-70 family)|uniref:Sigma-70 family RNA polymerase sigma factor n=1 Tax=Flavobacterium piscisymbiosum TaxID=2893753 RepID=A0ABS8MGP0_9FLAO|nr:sigma-70 family RNA polymerase sigma factor [Flavobacterium sp. F-30]MCC9064664.1 sigma-70 family RNA polymerase sigma factor [Flavobacterium sp. F-30]
MENKESDINLWKQIKKGDAHAYHKLYDSYADLLFSFGMQYTNDEALVQDAIHDIFVELHRYRKTLSEDVIIKSYLFRSVQNNIFKKLKSQSKVVRLDAVSDSIYKTDSTEEELIYNETIFTKHANLALAITSLTAKQRHALQLRFSEDQSYEEISSTLEISLESCRTLIYRALKELRKKL